MESAPLGRNQGSLDGSVTLVSKKVEEGFRASANLSAGSFDYQNPSITGSYSENGMYASAGYSYRRTDNGLCQLHSGRAEQQSLRYQAELPMIYRQVTR